MDNGMGTGGYPDTSLNNLKDWSFIHYQIYSFLNLSNMYYDEFIYKLMIE